MYRSSVVRRYSSFFDTSLPHADFEKCMEILECWDFGFVHQLLSFSRVDDKSITSSLRTFQPYALDRYIVAQRYAPVFLEAREAGHLRRKSKRAYYRALAGEAIRLRHPAFWRYHEVGLKTLNETLNWPYLMLQIALELLWIASNPGRTAARVLRSWKKRMRSKASSEGTRPSFEICEQGMRFDRGYATEGSQRQRLREYLFALTVLA